MVYMTLSADGRGHLLFPASSDAEAEQKGAALRQRSAPNDHRTSVYLVAAGKKIAFVHAVDDADAVAQGVSQFGLTGVAEIHVARFVATWQPAAAA